MLGLSWITEWKIVIFRIMQLTLALLVPVMLAFANSDDPDQMASEEANWSGSALFVVKNVNLYQTPWSKNLIGAKI